MVMENKTADEALSSPFTSSLAQQYASLTNYHAISHPSLPNYLAMTSGDTYGITDDGYHQLGTNDLGHQLSAAGISWRAYMEGMSGGCMSSGDQYALKHNPFAYYGGSCPANVVDASALQADLVGSTPRFVWITPNLCNDTHDCPVATGDGWLRTEVGLITASPAWLHGGVLLLTWDEDDSGPIATIVVAPNLKAHASAIYHDHYSLLATIEDRLGVPRLGNARTATPFNEVLP
jgi:phosphatidylinositol-3-phosphatase